MEIVRGRRGRRTPRPRPPMRRGSVRSLLELVSIQVSTLVIVYEPEDVFHLAGGHLGESRCLEELLWFKGVWV